MKMIYKLGILIVLMLLIIPAVSFAAETANTTTPAPINISVMYSGATPIRAEIALAKSNRTAEREAIKQIKSDITTGKIRVQKIDTTARILGVAIGKETFTEKLVDENDIEITEVPKVKERRITEDVIYNKKVVVNGTEIAETPEEKEYRVGYELAMKDNREDAKLTGERVKPTMESVRYPYVFNKTTENITTVITIESSKYDAETTTMWYWVRATRDGKEVYTDSPVWIYPAPITAIISQTHDKVKNEMKIVLKEDPKAALESVLQSYVDSQPLGKAVSGTR